MHPLLVQTFSEIPWCYHISSPQKFGESWFILISVIEFWVFQKTALSNLSNTCIISKSSRLLSEIFTEMDVQYFSCLKNLGPFEMPLVHMVDFLHEKPQSFPRKSVIILGKLLSNPTFDPTIPPSMPDSSTVWPNVQGIWMNLGGKGCWEVAMFDVDCSKKNGTKHHPVLLISKGRTCHKAKKQPQTRSFHVWVQATFENLCRWLLPNFKFRIQSFCREKASLGALMSHKHTAFFQ